MLRKLFHRILTFDCFFPRSREIVKTLERARERKLDKKGAVLLPNPSIVRRSYGPIKLATLYCQYYKFEMLISQTEESKCIYIL